MNIILRLTSGLTTVVHCCPLRLMCCFLLLLNSFGQSTCWMRVVIVHVSCQLSNLSWSLCLRIRRAFIFIRPIKQTSRCVQAMCVFIVYFLAGLGKRALNHTNLLQFIWWECIYNDWSLELPGFTKGRTVAFDVDSLVDSEKDHGWVYPSIHSSIHYIVTLYPST